MPFSEHSRSFIPISFSILIQKFCAGYLIPKGWKVMPLFRNIHHNPEFFSDPQNFDPSRFEVGTAFHRKRVYLFEAERMISAASFGFVFLVSIFAFSDS